MNKGDFENIPKIDIAHKNIDSSASSIGSNFNKKIGKNTLETQKTKKCQQIHILFSHMKK